MLRLDRLGPDFCRRDDFEITLFDLLLDPIEPRALGHTLPRRPPTVEHRVHFLERLALRLRRGQEHVDEGGAVEGGEDHVHFPIDAPEQRRDREGERAVPCPIRRGGEGDGLGADLGREDFGRVGPGGWAPGDGEGADEEVGHCHDGFGHGGVPDEGPGDGAKVGVGVRLTVGAFERTDDEEEGHHAEGAEEERWATSPSVEVKNRREGKGHVEDVLD